MALLIDGYNLLNATSIFGGVGPGTELHRTRLAFLNFLASSFTKRQCAETTIVFDAAGAPPGLPHSIMHDGMTIHFARQHSNADEMIEELLEHWSAPKSLTVVSSDHRVQRAARRCGATFVDSDRWYSELLEIRRKNAAATREGASKPVVTLTPDELAYWMNEFRDAPSLPADAEHIGDFPPGYAEDVEDED